MNSMGFGLKSELYVGHQTGFGTHTVKIAEMLEAYAKEQNKELKQELKEAEDTIRAVAKASSLDEAHKIAGDYLTKEQ